MRHYHSQGSIYNNRRSKDGECIKKTGRDHETATSVVGVGDGIWIFSYSGGRTVAIETWGFGPLTPSSGQNLEMLAFVNASDRFRQWGDD